MALAPFVGMADNVNFDLEPDDYVFKQPDPLGPEEVEARIKKADWLAPTLERYWPGQTHNPFTVGFAATARIMTLAAAVRSINAIDLANALGLPRTFVAAVLFQLAENDWEDDVLPKMELELQQTTGRYRLIQTVTDYLLNDAFEYGDLRRLVTVMGAQL